MVDEFSSEQEQVDAIKKWLKSNGPGIIVGIIIGLSAIGGWRYWNSYQQTRAEQASIRFDNVVKAINTDDEPALAKGEAVVLKEHFSDSAYAVFAAFLLAKKAIEQNDNAAAVAELKWVIDNSDQQELIDIARLRLARVLLAEDRLEDARRHLDQITSSQFIAEQEELKGDIYLAANNPEQARTAYEAAQAAAGAGASGSLLQMKIENLPSSARQ